jgi:glycosyltransferase involved in cell wall biosynthesis
MISASGIGKVIENILKRLIPAKQGWEFSLIGCVKDLTQFSFSTLPNVKLINCESNIYTIREQFEVIKKIPKNTDLLWVPHYNVPLFYSGKMLVTIHDVYHLVHPDSLLKKTYAKIMFNKAVEKATKIICVSQFTATELQKYTHVNANKINVIYNGIDESWFNILKKDFPGNSYFIYVGNIKPHKNLARLLQAFRLIKDKVSQNLILVGKKEGFLTGMNNIAGLIKGMEDRVTFTGYVSDAELQQYVSHADALVLPSLYEGFGLPPLEAMACGCPVVVSKAASLPEVCKDAAIYCDPYNIQDIADKMLESSHSSHIEAGKELAATYLWDKTVQLMVNVCEEFNS